MALPSPRRKWSQARIGLPAEVTRTVCSVLFVVRFLQTHPGRFLRGSWFGIPTRTPLTDSAHGDSVPRHLKYRRGGDVTLCNQNSR